MFIVAIFLFLIIILFIAVIFFFFIFALDTMIWRHDLPTSKPIKKTLIKIISQYNPQAKNFYDLGCGRGTVVLFLKKALPQLSIYGVDNNLTRIFFAKLKSLLLRRKVNLKKEDIFQIDLRNTDIVYAYLWYDLMPPLEKKLQKELKTGAIVITNTSKFPTWQPIGKINTWPNHPLVPDYETLFIYKKT